MIVNLDDIQQGLSDIAGSIFNGDTKFSKVITDDKACKAFYHSQLNRVRYMELSMINYFG